MAEFGAGPLPDMTPQDERIAVRNAMLGAGIAERILDACPDPADVLTVLTMTAGIILTGFDTDEERDATAEKIRCGALHFVRATDD